jgi:hypothetical protein
VPPLSGPVVVPIRRPAGLAGSRDLPVRPAQADPIRRQDSAGPPQDPAPKFAAVVDSAWSTTARASASPCMRDGVDDQDDEDPVARSTSDATMRDAGEACRVFRSVVSVLLRALGDFSLHPQGRPCGRPPTAPVLAPAGHGRPAGGLVMRPSSSSAMDICNGRCLSFVLLSRPHVGRTGWDCLFSGGG